MSEQVKSPVDIKQTATAEVTKAPTPPTPPPPPAKTHEIVAMAFNGKTQCNLKVPVSVDLDAAWEKFQQDHNFISDKPGAHPPSFVGECCTVYGCEQAGLNDKVERTVNYTI